MVVEATKLPDHVLEVSVQNGIVTEHLGGHVNSFSGCVFIPAAP